MFELNMTMLDFTGFKIFFFNGKRMTFQKDKKHGRPEACVSYPKTLNKLRVVQKWNEKI